MSEFASLVTDTAEASIWLLHSDSGRVTYAAPGSIAGDFDAIVGPESAERAIEPPGELLGYKRSVTVQAADLTPVMRGACTVDDISYSIRSLERTTGGQWILELYRAAATEVTRAGYRRTT